MSQNIVEQPVARDLTSDRQKKIPAITGIRGVAACWVVLFHAFTMETNLPNAHLPAPIIALSKTWFISRGYLGVDLFFILSGFVLFLIYRKRLRTAKYSELKKFVIGRIFRIFPLHWFVLICMVSVFVLFGWQLSWPVDGPYTAKTFMLSVLLVQSWVGMPTVWNGPAWSLSNELLAYILFPFLVPGIWRVRSGWVAAALILGAFSVLGAACIIYHQPGFAHLKHFGILRCLMEFPAGMLLCHLFERNRFTAKTASGFFVAGAFLLVIAMIDINLDPMALLAFSLLIISCAIGSPIVNAILGNPICRWLGDISFSIYLIHFSLLSVCARIAAIYHPGSATYMIILLGIATLTVLPLAHLTWRFIEVPGQALGRRLIAKATGADADLTANRASR